ncbi:MAG: Uncharacterized protein XD91_0849 [Clostridiales bacterium 38_11]|nr:MAG: Uncharacterized protein XD91_0849 [Clostridiales bacterium 38_11]HBH11779.1 hypothetical protein [Clostridiales bacterium]
MKVNLKSNNHNVAKIHFGTDINLIGGITMNNKNSKELTINKTKFKACGTITCIHNVNSKCIQKECEMYERFFRQEY